MADKVENPFDILSDVGCCNEQINSAVEMLVEDLHEEMERAQGNDQTVLRDRIYKLYLFAELIHRQLKANDLLFHGAEQALYDAGVHSQFPRS